jgi:hypothetical protein
MQWPNWLTATPAEQRDAQRRYREEICRDQQTNYDGLKRALAMSEAEAQAYARKQRGRA